MADSGGTTQAPQGGIDNVDLAIAIGVSVVVFLLILVVILLCCCSQRKRKARLKGKDPETQRIKAQSGDGVYVVSGIDNPAKGEITDSGAIIPEVTVTNHTEEVVQESQDFSDLYATVNKTKKSDVNAGAGDVEEQHSTENTDNFKSPGHDDSLGQTSSQIDASRNSPDGAPDLSEERTEHVILSSVETRSVTVHKERHVSSTGTDVVSVDEDITKLPSDGQYLKVDHEISFSSDEDHSSLTSKPSVVFEDTKLNDDYDRLRLQTTTATSQPVKVGEEFVQNESFYSSVSRQNSFIIPPDSTGMARVFVNTNNSNVRGKSHAGQPYPVDAVVMGGDEVFLDQSMNSLRRIPEQKEITISQSLINGEASSQSLRRGEVSSQSLRHGEASSQSLRRGEVSSQSLRHGKMPSHSARHGEMSAQPPSNEDVANQILWTKKMHQMRHIHPQEHVGHRYRVDTHNNVSTHPDGSYTLARYVVPYPRYRYTSMSTLESVGRDRSQSIDSSMYYLPSRRNSIGTGSSYSVVASTHDPRRRVHKRLVPEGKYKTNKPLSMYDLHKMKYRSHKGSLPPFDVPL